MNWRNRKRWFEMVVCLKECADLSSLLRASRQVQVGRVLWERLRGMGYYQGMAQFRLIRRRETCGRMSLSVWGEKQLVCEMGKQNELWVKFFLFCGGGFQSYIKLGTFFIYYSHHRVYNEIIANANHLCKVLWRKLFLLSNFKNLIKNKNYLS